MDESKSEDIFYKTILSKKLNILFWDDEAKGEYKALFTEIEIDFKNYGWNPCIVADKKKAAELALKEKFDAVVLDLLEGRGKDAKRVGLDIYNNPGGTKK